MYLKINILIRDHIDLYKKSYIQPFNKKANNASLAEG